MSKKLKVKVKPGKAKFKLKSGDDVLPLGEADLRALLGAALASAGAPGLSVVPTREGLPAGLVPAASPRPSRFLPEGHPGDAGGSQRGD